jgi:hypothetical protein
MTMQLTSHDIDGVKRELGHLLPEVKSSHRVEAMARGLGYQTNASLRAKLQNGAAPCALDEEAFADYLTSKDFPKPPYATLAEAVSRVRDGDVRKAIEAVMQQLPDLSTFGFDVYDEENKSPAERQAEFEKKRAEMLTSHYVEQFKLAVPVLSTKAKRATFNKAFTTYNIKHAVERHYQAGGMHGASVSNGMLIAAAAHLGFEIDRRHYMSAYLNIEWNAPLPEVPSGPASRTKATRNLIVAAVNAGLAQNIFGLGDGENYWSGNGQQFTFQIGGIDACAYVHEWYKGGPLMLHIAANPTFRVDLWIENETAGFYAGDAFVVGLFNREHGARLQKAYGKKSCFRKSVLSILSNIEIGPEGYAAHDQATKLAA